MFQMDLIPQIRAIGDQLEQLDVKRPLNCTLDSTLAKNMLDAHLKPISEIFI